MGLKSSFFNHEWMLLSCVQRKNRNISGDIPIFLFSILRTTLTSFPYLLLLLQFYPWRVACKTALHNLVLSYCVTFRYVKPPIFTLCVGNAWGEAALLLAAGAKGNRSALPSSTIMIKQPIARFQGQATDVDLARKEVKNVKAELVSTSIKYLFIPFLVICTKNSAHIGSLPS